MSTVAERLAEVRKRLEQAAERARRDPGSITLVAVSKKHPALAIREAYAAGQRDFGENYAQELAAKRAELADLPELRWHFIGALQSNKARVVVPGTVLIHAVDRPSVAEALARRAQAAGVLCRALLEVNVGAEASKAGVPPGDVPALLTQCAAWSGLQVSGLMCIPPAVEDPEQARPFFRQLRNLRDGLQPRIPALTALSMGMTHDFEVAIEEGATHVRVGTAIFGARETRPT
jgi:pyridoxal phosphate enzyme (YggS family)